MIAVQCVQDYRYGAMPKLSAKDQKELGYKPGEYHEYAIDFKAGQVYELDDQLATRLLRDWGPYRSDDLKKLPVHFQAVDGNVGMRLAVEGKGLTPQEFMRRIQREETDETVAEREVNI